MYDSGRSTWRSSQPGSRWPLSYFTFYCLLHILQHEHHLAPQPRGANHHIGPMATCSSRGRHISSGRAMTGHHSTPSMMARYGDGYGALGYGWGTIPQASSSSYSALEESGRLCSSEELGAGSVSESVISPSSDSSDWEAFVGLFEESLAATESGDSSSASDVFSGDVGEFVSAAEGISTSNTTSSSWYSWLVVMLKKQTNNSRSFSVNIWTWTSGLILIISESISELISCENVKLKAVV